MFEAIDPENCATLSKDVIAQIIRREMGFDGLLMSDDLSMKALSGTLRQRGERALSAGCDMLLHCNGERAEMVEVAHAAIRLDGKALERARAAEEARGTAQGLDVAATNDAMARCFAEAGLEAPAP